MLNIRTMIVNLFSFFFVFLLINWMFKINVIPRNCNVMKVAGASLRLILKTTKKGKLITFGFRRNIKTQLEVSLMRTTDRPTDRQD